MVKFEDKTDTRKWKKVEAGARVELGGETWEVVEAKRKGDEVRVKLKSKAGVFTRKVPADKKVEVVKEFDLHTWAKEQNRKGRAEAKAQTAAHKDASEFNPDPWRVDPADILHARAHGHEGGGGPWSKPADQAEANVTAILGAKMLGVQTEPGGVYAVPPLDSSTIKSHLYLMHGVTAGAMKHKELVARHESDHTKPAADQFVPHHHTKERPK